jgi:RNA polymerase sigma factor (sigma-70 family)
MQLSLNKDDQSLINQVNTGDEDALRQFIATYSPRLYCVVRRFMGDDTETESILQETFWKFWQSPAKYQNGQPVYPYLVSIAVNLVRDRWRLEYRFADSDIGIEMEMVADLTPLPNARPNEQSF